MGFPELADSIYDLLVLQDKDKISAKQMATLSYFAGEGMILSYEDGTALFCDDITKPEKVKCYRQTAKGERKLLHSWTDDYRGAGKGRFFTDDRIFYCSGGRLNCYWPADDIHQMGGDEYGNPELAINYLYDSEGDLWVAYIDGDIVRFIDFSSNRGTHLQFPKLEDGAVPTGMYVLDTYFVFTFEGEDSSYNFVNVEDVKEGM